MEGLKQIETKYPSLSTTTQEVADLYNKKLWHNLTDKIEQIVNSKELDQKGEDLLNFYEQFVSKFELKVNLRKLALLVLAISGKLTDPKRATAFVEAVHSKIEKDKRKDKEKAEALIILKIELALWKLRLQDFSGCKHTLGEAKEAIEKEGFVDTSVQSTYYRVKSEYLKRSEELNEFYKHSLLYLAYTPIETIPLHQQQAIAFDIGIAALLGDKIYNFGELLAHPIVESLNGTQAEWLVKMLYAFNKGDIAQYKSLIQTYRQQLEQSPILSKHSKFLEEKIQLMCIMELVFQRETGNRTIPFTEIASATGRNLDSVEVLLLRALSYTLIKGVIDQIDQTIHVTWVQPRVLDKSQISNLKEKIGAWLGKVDDTINYLETEGMMAI